MKKYPKTRKNWNEISKLLRDTEKKLTELTEKLESFNAENEQDITGDELLDVHSLLSQIVDLRDGFFYRLEK